MHCVDCSPGEIHSSKSTHPFHTLSPEEDSWFTAYMELQKRIQAHENFPALLRSMHTRPNGWIPSRRSARLATVICEGLGIDPSTYRGNVFGAALAYARERGPQ